MLKDSIPGVFNGLAILEKRWKGEDLVGKHKFPFISKIQTVFKMIILLDVKMRWNIAWEGGEERSRRSPSKLKLQILGKMTRVKTA
eukprot:366451-Amorphochlora_amoeboformis.AAC.1